MRDIFAAFGSEFFRPLATILLPGLLCLGPLLIAVTWVFEPLRAFMNENHVETALALILLCTFAGLLLEDVGARIELWLFNYQFRAAERDSRNKEWYDYLRLACKPEPVGYKYIQSLVLRLKFELGCVAAIPFSIWGIWFWPTMYLPRWIATGVAVVIGIYLFVEAKDSVRNLAILRHELLSGIVKSP